MPESPRKYVDHPAPGAGLVALLLIVLCITVVAVTDSYNEQGTTPLMIAVVAIIVVTVAFFFWPLYTTYYTLSESGILVRYGPWKRLHPWSDFTTAYWQRGMFAMRIGWPTITPCVRLTNSVSLRRKKGFGLYLTPNDPPAFLRKISEFAPDLTKETLV